MMYNNVKIRNNKADRQKVEKEVSIMTTTLFNGKEYTFTQEAYYNAGTGMYEAHVKDDEGRYYKAYFFIANENAEEECDMCNWDVADELEYIGEDF